VTVSETGEEAAVLAGETAELLETGNQHISLHPNTTPRKTIKFINAKFLLNRIGVAKYVKKHVNPIL